MLSTFTGKNMRSYVDLDRFYTCVGIDYRLCSLSEDRLIYPLRE